MYYYLSYVIQTAETGTEGFENYILYVVSEFDHKPTAKELAYDWAKQNGFKESDLYETSEGWYCRYLIQSLKLPQTGFNLRPISAII